MRVGDRVAVAADLGAGEKGVRLGEHGVALEHEVGRTLARLGHLLRDLGDAPARRQGQIAGVGREATGKQGEQRGLAGAVAADQADLFARVDSDAGAIEDELDAAAKRQLTENEHARF